MEKTTGIIILAAGSSSRIGHPKQLLQFKGRTLLSHTVAEANAVSGAAVMVVTGANREMIETELKNTGAMAVYNEEWEQGMGSSVRAGLSAILTAFPDIRQCILTVCDQPYIETEIFNSLIEEQGLTGMGIIASAYVGTLGTPTLFTKKYFSELLSLSGQEGAKKLLEQFSEDVGSVPFEQGAIDIDTIEDYNQLINLQ